MKLNLGVKIVLGIESKYSWQSPTSLLILTLFSSEISVCVIPRPRRRKSKNSVTPDRSLRFDCCIMPQKWKMHAASVAYLGFHEI